MMKMAAVCEILFLLLWGTITSSAGSSECGVHITTGTDFTIPLNLQKDQQYKLRWWFNSQIIFDRKGSSVIEGSSNSVDQSGSLKLTKVQKAQAGTYTPEAYSNNGVSMKDLQSTHLCVWDHVKKPEVKQKCLSSDTEVEFTCIAKNPTGITYKWLQGGEVLPKNVGPTLKLETKNLKAQSISCTVANKASNMTSEAVFQDCIKSGISFPSKVLGVSVWFFVAGGGGVVLVLILITIVCCIRAKRKKSMRIKDEEELRLGWTNPQQQQHQPQHQHSHPPSHPHRHHQHAQHHQQQPAGHTGPRQPRTKHPRPRAPDPTNGQPQPNPRRAQAPKPPIDDDDDQPPPLPQPRKKGPKTPKM